MIELLHHVTLTTGDVLRAPRGMVSDDVVAELWPLVVDLVTGDAAVPRTREIPRFPGWQVQCITFHGPPLFRVYGPAPKGGGERECVASFGVVVEPDDGAESLWRQLWKLGHLAGEPDPVPTEIPWCGVVLDVGILNARDAVHWLADFEQCIAWTLWSIRHEPQH